MSLLNSTLSQAINGVTDSRLRLVEGVAALPMIVYSIVFFGLFIGQLVGIYEPPGNKYMPLVFFIALLFPYAISPLALTATFGVLYRKHSLKGACDGPETVFTRAVGVFWGGVIVFIAGVMVISVLGIHSLTEYAILVVMVGYVGLIALGSVMSVIAVKRGVAVLR